VVCSKEDAIGEWIDPPATPDRVLKAFGKAWTNFSSRFLILPDLIAGNISLFG